MYWWDPLNAAAAITGRLVTYERTRLTVVQSGVQAGRTVVDPRGARIRLGVAADAQAFRRTTSWPCSTGLHRSSREEVRRGGDRAADARESIHRVLVAVHSVQHALELRRQGLQRRKLRGELVERKRLPIALGLIGGHRLVERTAAGERLVQGCGAETGVSERVADPEGRDEVLRVARASPTSAHPGPNGSRRKFASDMPTKRASRRAA